MNHKKVKKAFFYGLVTILLCTGCSSEEAMSFQEDMEVFSGQQLQWEQAPEQEKYLKVFVCGAVVTSCVAELPVGSRVEDALAAAGGFTPEAHREYLNLARRLTDGEKLYFPTRQEAEILLQQEELARNSLVDINKADILLLCTLPGIGESRAREIITYRDENGPFSSVEELKKVDCITENIYDKLEDKIIVTH